jgi:predicted Zn-dependent peptidase
VREKRGLVYSISSGVTSYSDAGVLTVYAGTSLDSVDQVVRLTIEEFRRLRGDKLPVEELRRAKDHLKGSLMLSLENTGSRMSHLARQEIYFERRFSLDEIIAGIEAVTDDDVCRIADKIFSGGLGVSILGNLGRYRPRATQLRI